MKNFGILFGYELKKLWKHPMTWVAVALCSAVMIYMLPIPNYDRDRTFTATDAQGNTVTGLVTAEEQARIRIAGSNGLSGQLMDEAFFEEAHRRIIFLSPIENWNDEEEVRRAGELQDAQEGYFYLLDPSYCEAYHQFGSRLKGSAADFYSARRAALDEEMTRSGADYGFNGEDLAYWARLEEQLEEPWVFQPIQGPARLLEMMSFITIMTPMLAGLCVCDLFSRDRRLRTHPVLVSSKQGRGCLFLAKALAGGVTAMLATVLVSAASIAYILILYGPWGWNGAVQLWSILWYCRLPIKIWQAVLILVGLLAAYALVCGALASAVSMWTGSGVASLAAMAGMTAGVMVLTYYWQPKITSLSQRLLLARLPTASVNVYALSMIYLTHIGPLRLNWTQTTVLLYLAVAAVLWALCALGWRRSAKGRV